MTRGGRTLFLLLAACGQYVSADEALVSGGGDLPSRDALAHPGKGAGPDGISQLFDWYRGDFEGRHGSVEGFVRACREGGDAEVDYDATLPYSWELDGS